MVSIVKVDTLQNLNSSNLITQANATTITVGSTTNTIEISGNQWFSCSKRKHITKTSCNWFV
jgi:hypothetical protein